MITEEEANAMLIAEQFISSQRDSSLIKEFKSLLIKIKSVLKHSQKENLSKLENRIAAAYPQKEMNSNWLSIVQKAITNTKVLDITYHSLYKNEKTRREIEPLGIYYTQNNAWVVIANCRLRKELREFRIDRILSAQVTSQHFDYQEDFSLKNYFYYYFEPS